MSDNFYTGTGEANPRPPISHKRGYSSVGKNIFAMDTEQLRKMREANKKKLAAQRKQRPQSAAQASSQQPRYRNDGDPSQPGDIIHDYYQDEFKQYQGLTYALPQGVYIPLRNATTKNGKSLAQSIYGGATKKAKDVRYRNPKMYMKKSGDMSQKYALRSKQMAKDPIFDKAKQGYTTDRYFGSDYYTRQYGALEVQAISIKHPQPACSKGLIERPPKGAEQIKSKRFTELKNYPTTYKQEYLEPKTHNVESDFAGKPLKYTPVGDL